MRRKNKNLELKPDTLCVFEDGSFEQFEPLQYFHPVWGLTAGIFPLYAKISSAYEKLALVLSCREEVAAGVDIPEGTRCNEFQAGEYLFINGRVARGDKLAERIPIKGPETLYINGDNIIAARVKIEKAFSGNVWPVIRDKRDHLPHQEVDSETYQYLLDIVRDNARAITADAQKVPLGKSHASLYPTTMLLNPKQIYTGEGTILGPGVVLDASKGPIVIDDNVEVMANSFLQGPIFIGEKTIIKAGATLYGGTSIGHTCKIGGEVEAALFLPFTNKQHHGFIGHSYIGSWCNLGAGTTNSDLKNTYGEVSIQLGKRTMETGTMFAGLFLGDHSKVGINTSCTTGTVIGPVSNVATSQIPPRYLPPFSWHTDEGTTQYELEKAAIVAERAMRRRGKHLPQSLRDLFRLISKRAQTR